MTAVKQDHAAEIAELQAMRVSQEEVLEAFDSSQEQIDKANHTIKAIDAEIAQLKKMIAEGEMFADGVQQDVQFSDETGTFTENADGRMEPDLSSECCSEESATTPEEGKKGKQKGASRKQSRATVPAGLAETNVGTMVVGSTPPENGYPMMPGYGKMLETIGELGLSEKRRNELIPTLYDMHLGRAKEFLGPSLDSEAHQVARRQTIESVKAMLAEQSSKEMQAAEDESSSLIEYAKEALAAINAAGQWKPETVYSRAFDAAKKQAKADKMVAPTADMIMQHVHIEIDALAKFSDDWPVKIPASFGQDDFGGTELDDIVDYYLSIDEQLERLKTQYERRVARKKQMKEVFDAYIKPAIQPLVEEKIKGKSTKYVDLATGRLQLRSSGGNLGLLDEEKLTDWLKVLAPATLKKLGVETVVSYKYGKKEIEKLAEEKNPLLPLTAFGETEKVNTLYIQGPCEK